MMKPLKAAAKEYANTAHDIGSSASEVKRLGPMIDNKEIMAIQLQLEGESNGFAFL